MYRFLLAAPAVSCFQLLPRPVHLGGIVVAMTPAVYRRRNVAAAAALAAKVVPHLVNDMLHHNGSFGLVLHQSSTSPALAAKRVLHLVNDVLHHSSSFELCTPPVRAWPRFDGRLQSPTRRRRPLFLRVAVSVCGIRLEAKRRRTAADASRRRWCTRRLRLRLRRRVRPSRQATPDIRSMTTGIRLVRTLLLLLLRQLNTPDTSRDDFRSSSSGVRQPRRFVSIFFLKPAASRL
jgi:hypothetical protein